MSISKRFLAVFEYLSAFVFGGVMYGALETVFRGYTHPSMLVTGGICFAGLYAIDKHCRRSLLFRALCGAALITAAEFVAGCICNIWLGWDVWDYSRFSMNLMGQICLQFSVLWGLLSIPAYMCAGMLRGALGVKRAYSDVSAPSASLSSSDASSEPPEESP